MDYTMLSCNHKQNSTQGIGQKIQRKVLHFCWREKLKAGAYF